MQLYTHQSLFGLGGIRDMPKMLEVFLLAILYWGKNRDRLKMAGKRDSNEH